MTIDQALIFANTRFREVEIDSALLDAEVLLAHVLACDRAHVLAHPDHCLTNDQERIFMGFVRERSIRKPLAYITGHKEFYGLDFLVDKYTLIPRPETERLVEAVRNYSAAHPHAQSIIELGVGSGCVIISILKNCPHIARAYAIDRVTRALEVAKKNAERMGVSEKISFKRSDMWKQVPTEQQFDIVVANLPYLSVDETVQAKKTYPEIAYEPQIALLGGTDGLVFLRSFFKGVKRHLRVSTTLFLEIGVHQQDAIEQLTKKYLPEAHCTFIFDECHSLRGAIIYASDTKASSIFE